MLQQRLFISTAVIGKWIDFLVAFHIELFFHLFDNFIGLIGWNLGLYKKNNQLNLKKQELRNKRYSMESNNWYNVHFNNEIN